MLLHFFNLLLVIVLVDDMLLVNWPIIASVFYKDVRLVPSLDDFVSLFWILYTYLSENALNIFLCLTLIIMVSSDWLNGSKREGIRASPSRHKSKNISLKNGLKVYKCFKACV